MHNIRPPAVAGMFYPADATELQAQVNDYLRHPSAEGMRPKALIVPHAGYVYSGPVAASAYARLRPLREQITRVILLGPAHRVAFRGLAASSATAFRTPLGDIPLDTAMLANLSVLPQVRT
ncbi:MAG TPA: AmmeMemoRadiSam system protein B, partial [Gammaproteobacteria bacterium]|nr:AmmeMemoRadiSam system protein B [Gammaproteobacteria bacterium]